VLILANNDVSRLSRATLRSKALDKLAGFTSKSSSPVAKEDYGNLSKSLGNSGALFAKPSPKSNGTNLAVLTNGNGQLHTIPIQTKELEVLLALASSAQHQKDPKHARSLLEQLGLYLGDSYCQKFVPSAMIRG
jgi:hypothetical protein